LQFFPAANRFSIRPNVSEAPAAADAADAGAAAAHVSQARFGSRFQRIGSENTYPAGNFNTSAKVR
jgi:hypothetical protein